MFERGLADRRRRIGRAAIGPARAGGASLGAVALWAPDAFGPMLPFVEASLAAMQLPRSGHLEHWRLLRRAPYAQLSNVMKAELRATP